MVDELELAERALRESRGVLFERGWTQFWMVSSDGAVCMSWAIFSALGGTSGMGPWCFSAEERAYAVATRAINLVAGAPSCASIPDWNDVLGRQFGEVIDMLEAAEKVVAGWREERQVEEGS